MCSEHLNHKEILPHISKTQKQKICDDCFAGKSTPGADVPVSAVGDSVLPSGIVQSPKSAVVASPSATSTSTMGTSNNGGPILSIFLFR